MLHMSRVIQLQYRVTLVLWGCETWHEIGTQSSARTPDMAVHRYFLLKKSYFLSLVFSSNFHRGNPS